MFVSGPGLRRVVTSSPSEWKYLLTYRRRLSQWRAAERHGSDFILAQGRESYLVSVHDKLVGQLLYCMGEFEFDKFERVAQMLGHPIRTVVDVGANVGSICIPAVTRGLAANAIAIEPDPLNAQLLRTNVAINSVTAGIDVHACAVGATTGETLTLEMNTGNFADHRIASSIGGDRGWSDAVVVPSYRLDDLVGDLDPARDLLWMDVQGYEGYVLDGAPRAVQAGVPLVMEFWPVGLNEHSGFDSIHKAASHYRRWYNLKEDAPVERPIPQLRDLFDAMLVHDEQTDVLLLT